MRFYLGTHMPNWLNTAGVPLFVSHRRLAGRRSLPRAAAPWALDSGGFTEISMFGEWRTTPAEYVTAVRRYRTEIGQLEWCATQDWMCESVMLARTGLSVADHQRRTVANYLELRHRAPDLPWAIPLQGATVADYLGCADRYEAAGVDLAAAPVVGLGSVCRRQATSEITTIVTALHARGIRQLHGFGVKTLGLRRIGHLIASADSMAWSYDARRRPPLPGCTTHINCANCPRYALAWRTRLLTNLPTPPAEGAAAA
ncbi:DUF7221 family queuine tRNA-ribosyltransferase-like protein [Allonocardiopsis opalescens]|uniref:DeoxyPurine in DNA protein A domain-containing protein n=1 Tax=Allonocardiopsis opalescens TaxID=1144618 RepID=A0A2T0Q962_9ACTN|nr:hypothetical protein [Allonocardiopsis opalescens]PRY00429.1 hypothetical protein CLV72_10258 [Allonocardiopsis opalescens]